MKQVKMKQQQLQLKQKTATRLYTALSVNRYKKLFLLRPDVVNKNGERVTAKLYGQERDIIMVLAFLDITWTSPPTARSKQRGSLLINESKLKREPLLILIFSLVYFTQLAQFLFLTTQVTTCKLYHLDSIHSTLVRW